MYGAFPIWLFWVHCGVIVGSFHALCKIPGVKISKRLLLPQFSSNFNQTLKKACNPGKCRPLLFSGNLPNFKYMALWREVTSATSCILVSSGKRSSRASRPLGLLFSNVTLVYWLWGETVYDIFVALVTHYDRHAFNMFNTSSIQTQKGFESKGYVGEVWVCFVSSPSAIPEPTKLRSPNCRYHSCLLTTWTMSEI